MASIRQAKLRDPEITASGWQEGVVPEQDPPRVLLAESPRHLIEHVPPDPCLVPLPTKSPGSKSSTHAGFVAKHRDFDQAARLCGRLTRELVCGLAAGNRERMANKLGITGQQTHALFLRLNQQQFVNATSA